MDLLESDASRLKFEAYIGELASVIGHADPMVPLRDYCSGLLLPGERKSVEPMLAHCAPLLRVLSRPDGGETPVIAAFRRHRPVVRSKGVADRTIPSLACPLARLIAEMPEIGTLSNKAIAKLAGLAPIARATAASGPASARYAAGDRGCEGGARGCAPSSSSSPK